MMGLQNNRVLFHYLALCVVATFITVNSLELRRVPARNVCCKNANRRSVVIEQRQGLPTLPTLLELMQIANDNMMTSSLQQVENDPFTAAAKKFGISPPPIALNDDSIQKMESQKAYMCSKMPCLQQFMQGPVCACNFNTGNVVTFKNRCDLKKHNCRFDTVFKVILDEICPWEFESRRREKSYEYTESKYFN